ncbi:phage/plasmid primase, P4 family [Methylobacterium frigidaeris]|uniref:SF3 helicase domain-containing protein n=1 Tax=Methylobacterium frigidaeris TaxID=2038277 RepID=A0AA37HDF3_9HYPH|nr:phage/plasmid primase, P4 family [Methylobacterium frigidaeris]GJD63456.1 hypothetical protein MPEAHAMD_3624 [Methylobacterium frigidaeris]
MMRDLQLLIDQGYSFTPLVKGSKRPVLPNWNERNLTFHDLQFYGPFPQNHNVGLLLGNVSNKLIDIDLDHVNTINLAKHFFPDPNVLFGRDGKPCSHYLYRIESQGRTIRFKHPETGASLIDLLGDGTQVVFPGSVHVSGEQVRFERGQDSSPTLVSYDALVRACRLTSVAALLIERWDEGQRHALSLAFAGFCAANKVEREVCERIVEAVCHEAGDEELQARLRDIGTSYDRLSAGSPVAGTGPLISLLDDKTVRQIRAWLCDREQSSQAVASLPAKTCSVMDLATDASAAEAFSRAVAEQLIFCTDDQAFYMNTSGVYRQVPRETVNGLILQFGKSAADSARSIDDYRVIKALSMLPKIKAIVELSKTHLAVRASEFDSDDNLVGCDNGILDLRNSSVSQAPSRVTKKLGVRFDPSAECPRFEAFIRAIFESNNDKISFVQRAIGYTLTGSTKEQCLFAAVGQGANGKSTLMNVIAALMGDYGKSTPMHALMVSKFGNDRTDDLAALKGIRFVSAMEGEAGQRLAVAKIKAMTGGDIISCRPLYGNLFTYKPSFKLWLATNDLPHISGSDNAIWRRIHIIDFPVTIPTNEQDRDLLDKLTVEMPGILNWALEGLREYNEIGLRPPESVLKATKAYRANNDTVAQFVDAACEIDPHSKTMMKPLYDAYVSWCDNSSIDPVSNAQFGKELTRLNFASCRFKQGNGRVGIRLA